MTDEEKKAAAEARNAYARAWRAKNPDKVRKYNANYWLRKSRKHAAMNNSPAKGNKEAENHEN